MLVRTWSSRGLLLCGRDCAAVQPSWKEGRQLLQVLSVDDVQYDPAVLLLGMSPRWGKPHVQRKTCTGIFVAASSTTARKWNQLKRPSLMNGCTKCVFIQWNTIWRQKVMASWDVVRVDEAWWHYAERESRCRRLCVDSICMNCPEMADPQRWKVAECLQGLERGGWLGTTTGAGFPCEARTWLRSQMGCLIAAHLLKAPSCALWRGAFAVRGLCISMKVLSTHS